MWWTVPADVTAATLEAALSNFPLPLQRSVPVAPRDIVPARIYDDVVDQPGRARGTTESFA